VNYDEMDGDRLRLPANRNCYKLSRASWALLILLVFVQDSQIGSELNGSDLYVSPCFYKCFLHNGNYCFYIL